MDNTTLEKRLSAALKASKALGKAASATERLKQLSALTSYLEALAGPDLIADIGAQRDVITRLLETRLAERREEIVKTALAKNLRHVRYEKYDRIDIFDVHYAGEKVSIRLGNLKDTELVDSDGAKTVPHLIERRRSLLDMCLPRDRFFRCIEGAIAMAASDGRAQDGKVAVRDLYLYVALRRQLEFERFVKQPLSINYTNYTLTDFAFELMHFGSDAKHGWTCGGRRLNNRGPAMSTQDRAVQLPDSTRTQVYMLWVE